MIKIYLVSVDLYIYISTRMAKIRMRYTAFKNDTLASNISVIMKAAFC
jgi:hypothetical protein